MEGHYFTLEVSLQAWIKLPAWRYRIAKRVFRALCFVLEVDPDIFPMTKPGACSYATGTMSSITQEFIDSAGRVEPIVKTIRFGARP